MSSDESLIIISHNFNVQTAVASENLKQTVSSVRWNDTHWNFDVTTVFYQFSSQTWWTDKP